MDDARIIAAGFSRAPQWCLNIGLAGRAFIVVGLILFLVSAVVMMLARDRANLLKWGVRLFALGVASVIGAMICLAVLFLKDQFQFEYVASHSWRDLPPIYKFAAVWSGQQGSFLLWLCMSALFGIASLRSTGIYKRWFVVVYALFLGALCAILSYETPFGLIQNMIAFGNVYIPPNGVGLVPSLQNYWVIVHPPTIFAGFGSLTVPFAFAMSAMFTSDLHRWIYAARPWILISLSTLGLGLIMGGLWAYETQGWGGFWAWDPVENVSFVPWLLTAALLHGVIVQASRKRWIGANLWLGALPFLLFVYGTFLTRSGFLDKFSVHSFAEMNRFALWILLGVLALAWASFITTWLLKARPIIKKVEAPRKEEGFARESAYVWGVLLLTCLAFAIAFGMSTPVLLGALGKTAAVADESLYDHVVVWFFAPIIFLTALAPFLSWRRSKISDLGTRSFYIFLFALAMPVGLFVINRWAPTTVDNNSISMLFGAFVPRTPWVLFLFYLTAIAIVANVWRLCEVFRQSKLGVGGFLAHMGVATVLAGLIVSKGLEHKENVMVMQGSPGQALGYTLTYKGMTSNPQSDRDNKILLSVTKANDPSSSDFIARPGYFLTTDESGAPSPFTWPHIQRGFLRDLYVSLQAPVFNLWDDAQPFAIGETKQGTDISITYLGLEQRGGSGQQGATFGAKLKVIEDGHTYYGEPIFTVGKGSDDRQITPSLRATIERIDPADQSIMLQMPYVKTVYPIELFYKPMTALIWLGALLLTVGGLLAAFYRRNSVATDSPSYTGTAL